MNTPRTYRYLHYDVFTDAPLEGNQLAVFPEPAGMSDSLMQAITREMNFSECTFIFPPDPLPHVASRTPPEPGATPIDVRMRIFTPGEELPMAGHPTIGSTFALVREGVIRPGQEHFVYGLGVGPTPVSLEWKGRDLDFAWMTQKNPQFLGQISDRAAFAAAIGLAAGDLDVSPPEVVSCGVPFLVAALNTRQNVDAIALDVKRFEQVCAASGIGNLPLFVFSTDRTGARGDETIYSRMLAPGLGVAEDPATGSASGPAACYIDRHRLIDRSRLSHIVSWQGVKMLRPSRIHISLDTEEGEISRVRVGGRSVFVGEGTLTV